MTAEELNRYHRQRQVAIDTKFDAMIESRGWITRVQHLRPLAAGEGGRIPDYPAGWRPPAGWDGPPPSWQERLDEAIRESDLADGRLAAAWAEIDRLDRLIAMGEQEADRARRIAAAPGPIRPIYQVHYDARTR